MMEKTTIAMTEPARVRLSSKNRGAFFFKSINLFFLINCPCSLTKTMQRYDFIGKLYHIFTNFTPVKFYPFTPDFAHLVPIRIFFCHISYAFVECTEWIVYFCGR